MSIESDQERLAQEKILEWIQRELDPDEMITVRQTPSDDFPEISIYSTLIPLDRVEYHRSHLEGYMPPSGFVVTSFGPNRQETTGIDRDRSGNQYLIIDRNPGKIGVKKYIRISAFYTTYILRQIQVNTS